MKQNFQSIYRIYSILNFKLHSFYIIVFLSLMAINNNYNNGLVGLIIPRVLEGSARILFIYFIWRDYARNSLDIMATKSPSKWIHTNVRPLSIVLRKTWKRIKQNPELRQLALKRSAKWKNISTHPGDPWTHRTRSSNQSTQQLHIFTLSWPLRWHRCRSGVGQWSVAIGQKRSRRWRWKAGRNETKQNKIKLRTRAPMPWPLVSVRQRLKLMRIMWMCRGNCMNSGSRLRRLKESHTHRGG